MKKLLLICFLVGYAEAGLTSEIANKLVGTFISQEGQVTIAGFSCYINSNGRISSWRLKYDAKVQCPGISPNAYEARGYNSRTGAKEHAVRGFFERANNEGRLTEQQWASIASYLGISVPTPPPPSPPTPSPTTQPSPPTFGRSQNQPGQFSPEQYSQLLQLLQLFGFLAPAQTPTPAPGFDSGSGK